MLLAYEAWDQRTADAWLVGAALVLMGTGWADVFLEEYLARRAPRARLHSRPMLYDQDHDQGEYPERPLYGP